MSEKALGGRPLAEVVPLSQLGRTTRLRKIRVAPTLAAGLVLLALVIVVAITAPLLTPYDPIEQQFNEAFLPPFSTGHILGTDNFGRDIWSRIASSTRLDLQIRLLSVSFPSVFGSLFAIARGHLGCP